MSRILSARVEDKTYAAAQRILWRKSLEKDQRLTFSEVIRTAIENFVATNETNLNNTTKE